jgi:hypothetical protein
VSLIGAAGLAVLVPFAMFALGTAVALVLRGRLDVAARLLTSVR